MPPHRSPQYADAAPRAVRADRAGPRLPALGGSLTLSTDISAYSSSSCPKGAFCRTDYIRWPPYTGLCESETRSIRSRLFGEWRQRDWHDPARHTCVTNSADHVFAPLFSRRGGLRSISPSCQSCWVNLNSGNVRRADDRCGFVRSTAKWKNTNWARSISS